MLASVYLLKAQQMHALPIFWALNNIWPMIISSEDITVSLKDMLSEVTNIRVAFITQEQ